MIYHKVSPGFTSSLLRGFFAASSENFSTVRNGPAPQGEGAAKSLYRSYLSETRIYTSPDLICHFFKYPSKVVGYSAECPTKTVGQLRVRVLCNTRTKYPMGYF